MMTEKTATRGLLPALLVLLAAPILLTGCDYARMKEQEALKTYKTRLPEMDKESIPVARGLGILRTMDPKTLRNPLPGSPDIIARGKEAYSYYCVMCHGIGYDGNGTVGQSFKPLPTSLVDPVVQDQTDGEIFYKLTFGNKRQPPLAHTVSENDRWAIIHLIRFLTQPKSS